MTHWTRIRSTATWLGVMATALIAIAWVLSCFFAIVFGRTIGGNASYCTDYCGLAGGCFFAQHDHLVSTIPFDTPLASKPLQLRRVPRWTMRWRPIWHRSKSTVRFISRNKLSLELPLWIPLCLVAGPTAVLLWRGRRRTPSPCCPFCDYNLTGNTTGTCPECGNPVTVAVDPIAAKHVQD